MNPNQQFYEALERISAAFPFEETRLEVVRTPAGQYRYVASLSSHDDLGLPFECSIADTLPECEAGILAYKDKRQPEANIKSKIRELEQKIAKLRVALMNLALPAWQPIKQLGIGNPAPAAPPEKPKFINVEATVEEEGRPF